jgi:hypothetical protein
MSSCRAGCNSVWRQDVKRLIDLERELPRSSGFWLMQNWRKSRAKNREWKIETPERRWATFVACSACWVGEQLACRVIGHC